MRIALIAHTNAPWTPHYARYFRDAGHSVCVISFFPRALEGIETHYVGRTPHSEEDKLLMVRRVPRIGRFLRTWAPDVVFSPYLISNGLVAALAFQGPIVVSARGGDIQDQPGATRVPGIIRRSIVRFVCGRARRVHAVSGGLVDALVAIGVPREKIDCFPVGVDLERFPVREPQAGSNAVPRFICTRRHAPVYRNADILEALADLKRRGRDFHCTFVGGGRLLPERRGQAAELGLHDCVTFLEQLPHEAVPARLLDAAIYISASSSDGASSSLLEAMACGLFPVVSRIRANEDWLRHGKTGLMFHLGDPLDLARSLERAIDDEQLRATAAIENRNLIKQRADLGANNRRLLELLQDMAGVEKGKPEQ